MEWGMSLVVLVVIMFTFLIPGVWIAISLGITGLLGIILAGQMKMIKSISNISWNTTNDFILTAIPLFLFMGEIILASGISTKFYTSIAKWLKPVPGGLLHSNIIASSLFSAISGSSVATAAGIGSAAIPEMKKRGYRKELIYGSIASGGTLGILIPPSIVLILYGSITEESVIRLFSAAVIPGIVLTLLFIMYTLSVTLIKKNRVKDDFSTDITFLESLKGILPLVALMVIILGSLYTGKITPTESAAVGSFLSLVIGRYLGHLNVKKIVQAAKNAIKTTTMIVFIMIGAQIFSFAIVSSGINRELTTWVADMGFSPLGLLLVVCLIYIILGCVMDGPSMMLLTIPLIFPLIVQAGYDPIWFGVVLVILIELGQITPPMGLNLFVIQSIDPESKISEVVKGAIPYVFIMLVMVGILIAFPDLALWLPSTMK